MDHSETIKPALRDAFLQRFDDMDLFAPWRSFPMPALIAAAPVTAFSHFHID